MSRLAAETAAMQFNKGLIASTVVLTTLNFYVRSIGCTLIALALIVIIALSLRGLTADNAGIYAFIVAQISPLSVQASFTLVLVYQSLCFLLLLSVLRSPGYGNDLKMFRKAAFQTAAFAALLPVAWVLLLYAKPFTLTATQLLAVSAIALLVALYALLFATRADFSIIRRSEH